MTVYYLESYQTFSFHVVLKCEVTLLYFLNAVQKCALSKLWCVVSESSAFMKVINTCTRKLKVCLHVLIICNHKNYPRSQTGNSPWFHGEMATGYFFICQLSISVCSNQTQEYTRKMWIIWYISFSSYEQCLLTQQHILKVLWKP